MLELEKTYLIKYLPDISKSENKEIIDIYFPKNSKHPTLRLRKNGNKFEMTKKIMLDNEVEKDNFLMPNFCLANVTNEEFIAGGMLCGKKYSDIEQQLKKFGY